MFAEEDLLPLSGLQHLVYCERQAALIHIERAWSDNRFTAEGNVLHQRTDERETEARGDLRIARGLPLRSLELGLSGRADTVELVRSGPDAGVRIDGLPDYWTVRPVEYKRGRPKDGRCDEVQLCAQALCLEEMLATTIDTGALYYGRTRSRHDVRFSAELRAITRQAAARFHQIVAEGSAPPPVADARCERCSLRGQCLPETRGRSASGYLRRMARHAGEDAGA